MSKKKVCIACSIFKNELEALKLENKIDVSLVFVDSILHMKPQILCRTLTPLIRNNLAEGNEVLLAYGDCHPFMDKMEGNLGAPRTIGHNCCEILLGKTEYTRRIKEGAFFLIPEWVVNWKEVFENGLGLKHQETAQSFMQSMHSYLLYIDTGLQKIPHTSLMEISQHCGLPVKIQKISLDEFLQNLLETSSKIDR